MSIVSEKKFLTEEEQATLKEIQSKSRALIGELGEIELVKLQLEKPLLSLEVDGGSIQINL